MTEIAEMALPGEEGVRTGTKVHIGLDPDFE